MGRFNGSLLRRLVGHTDWVRSVAFSPSDPNLAAADGSTVRLWKVSDGMPLRTLEGHSEIVNSVTYSPNGATLPPRDRMITLRLWNVSDGKPIRTLIGHVSSVTSVAFSPDGATLASGSVDMHVRLWNVSDGRLLLTVERHTGCVNEVAILSGWDHAGLGLGRQDRPAVAGLNPTSAVTWRNLVRIALREVPMRATISWTRA